MITIRRRNVIWFKMNKLFWKIQFLIWLLIHHIKIFVLFHSSFYHISNQLNANFYQIILINLRLLSRVLKNMLRSSLIPSKVVLVLVILIVTNISEAPSNGDLLINVCFYREFHPESIYRFSFRIWI